MDVEYDLRSLRQSDRSHGIHGSILARESRRGRIRKVEMTAIISKYRRCFREKFSATR